MPAIKKPNLHFDATLFTGNTTTVTATNAGGFQPDLVWIKDRSQLAQHVLTDSIRGTSAQLFSSLTNAEQTNSTYVTSFNSNGFTVGAGQSGTGVVNNNGDTFVGWQWKAGGASTVNTSGSISSNVSVNTTAGFSVVTYTGSGAAGTVGHGLGVAPAMIIAKGRGNADNWPVYHASSNASPATGHLLLNTTAAFTSTATSWNNTAPTSTVFSIGTDTRINQNTLGYVAYCFAEIAGFSKFGSYTGNGSTDGPFIFTNFRPKFVLIRRTNTTGSWVIFDAARNTYNVTNNTLYPDLANAEESGVMLIDFVSNGFKLRSSTVNEINASSSTYAYAAFAEAPFKYSTAR